MSMQIPSAELAEMARIAKQPQLYTIVDRTFGLPTALFGISVAAYFGFLAVMVLAFGTSELAIPMAIFIVYIVMAFGVPAMWTQIGPDDGTQRLSWSAFRRNGVMTHYGPVGAGAAMAQVLILPLAILAWGVAIAIIAAVVA